jgi:hypothetical protein
MFSDVIVKKGNGLKALAKVAVDRRKPGRRMPGVSFEFFNEMGLVVIKIVYTVFWVANLLIEILKSEYSGESFRRNPNMCLNNRSRYHFV